MYKLDLNLQNYDIDDIFNLFSIVPRSNITEETMKNAKKIVLKMHPDKSRLDAKYFLFFSHAYKKLFSVYEFQNKSSQAQAFKQEKINRDDVAKIQKNYVNTVQQREVSTGNEKEPEQEQRNLILQNFFEKNKQLSASNSGGQEFNKWFNEAFDQCKLQDEAAEKGYGDWLKSDDGISNETVKTAQDMENYKKKVQSLVTYSGVQNMNSAFGSGGSLMASSNTDFSSESYTDLRSAYEQSVIPVTMEDYENMPKEQYKSIEKYLNHRSNIDLKPPDKKESMKILHQQNEQEDSQSAALAYYHAKQLEKSKEKQEGFWATLLKLTG